MAEKVEDRVPKSVVSNSDRANDSEDELQQQRQTERSDEKDE